MELTSGQKDALLANILANQDANTIYQNGDLQGLADLYNAEASPAFVVWRTSVTQDEIMQNGFDWVRVDNLSVGQARIWEWLFDNLTNTINPSKTNVRAGITECWKGTAADIAVATAVFAHCKRNATRLERLFATGTGTTAVPGLLVVEGLVDYEVFTTL